MMYPVSEAFLSAWSGYGQRCHRARLSYDNGKTWADADVLSYRIDSSRGDQVQIRSQGTVELPPGVKLDASMSALLRVESGFVIDGAPEWVPIATLQIVSIVQDVSGKVSASGYSVDRRIGRANFRQPFWMGGGAARLRLLDVISTAANTQVLIDPRVGEASIAPATFDTDRWAAAATIALSIGAEVYADRLGSIRVGPIPSVYDATAIVLDGVILDRSFSATLEDAVSVVIVEGDKSDQTQIPRGIWEDRDPFSPTYIGGPFGEQVMRTTLSVATTSGQCADAARSIGLASRGIRSSVDLTTVQADFLDPGDVIGIRMPDGSIQRHLVDSIPYASGTASQRLTTRTGGGQ